MDLEGGMVEMVEMVEMESQGEKERGETLACQGPPGPQGMN